MHVRLTAFVFIIAAGAASAGPLDLCEHIESRQKEIGKFFQCILAKASLGLQDKIDDLKPMLHCADFYSAVKKVCSRMPFAKFMEEFLKSPVLYSEMDDLAHMCQKRAAAAHARPEQKQQTEAQSLWKRITQFFKKLGEAAMNMMHRIVKRFTSWK